MHLYIYIGRWLWWQVFVSCSRGASAFFTSFSDSESDHPLMLVLTDRKIKFVNSQVYLLNTRLIFGRTEKGKFMNNLMRTQNYIFVSGLDNLSQIKTIKVSPWSYIVWPNQILLSKIVSISSYHVLSFYQFRGQDIVQVHSPFITLCSVLRTLTLTPQSVV